MGVALMFLIIVFYALSFFAGGTGLGFLINIDHFFLRYKIASAFDSHFFEWSPIDLDAICLGLCLDLKGDTGI